MKIRRYYQAQGFSLVEMAVVLVILGFLMGAILSTVGAQREQLARSETESTLELAKKSLLGFAQTNGRLPCPATTASNGLEDPLGGGACTSQLGFLPAATLGIQPVDTNGFAIDAWNNRILYAVTQASVAENTQIKTPDYSFTTDNAMSNVGISNLSPSLRVCNNSSLSTSLTCSPPPINAITPEKNYLINNAVVVIYSLGATGSLASGGANENANPKVPTVVKSVFVSKEISRNSTEEFDHMVTWISPFVLYNAMIETGQLH